jgi:hypothetical protein
LHSGSKCKILAENGCDYRKTCSRLTQSKCQAFPGVFFVANPDIGCATFEIRVVATSSNLACANTGRIFYAAVPGRLKESIAHGTIPVAYCYGNGMASLVCVVCALCNIASRNSGHFI